MFNPLMLLLKRTHLLVLIGSGLSSSMLLTACSTDQKTAATTSQETYPVVLPMVTDTLYAKDYVADIQAVQNVEIRARVQGYVDRIHVDEGQLVRKGQLLFSISNPEYQGELMRAQASLKNAQAEAKSAEVDLKGIMKLVDKNVIADIEREKAQAKLDALRAKIDEAITTQTTAQQRIALTQIRAPFDGIVDRIPNKMGALVDEGTLLTTLSDNRNVFAYFNVPESEYLDFITSKKARQTNDIALVLANGQVHAFKGSIEKVDGQIDKNTGGIAFRARFPNPTNLLKQGSSGKVRMNQAVTNALLIPQKATFELQDKLFVFVVGANNKVQMRSFVPKLRLPQLYVVQSGIAASDRILYEGIQTVKEGDTIQPELISAPQLIAGLGK